MINISKRWPRPQKSLIITNYIIFLSFQHVIVYANKLEFYYIERETMDRLTN